MSASDTAKRRPDVPELVFERFLDELESAGVSTELVTKLRNTLLEERVFTERALKAAVLGEDSSS